jgi:hypothetical protein
MNFNIIIDYLMKNEKVWITQSFLARMSSGWRNMAFVRGKVALYSFIPGKSFSPLKFSRASFFFRKSFIRARMRSLLLINRS